MKFLLFLLFPLSLSAQEFRWADLVQLFEKREDTTYFESYVSGKGFQLYGHPEKEQTAFIHHTRPWESVGYYSKNDKVETVYIEVDRAGYPNWLNDLTK